MSDHIYGLPDAEVLYDDPVEVWENEIDHWRTEEHDRWTIEKWTTCSNTQFVPDPENIAQTVSEYAADNMGLENGWESWEDAALDKEVLEAFTKAIHLLASKVTYQSADAKIGEHVITLDVNGEPLIDGEALYRLAGA